MAIKPIFRIVTVSACIVVVALVWRVADLDVASAGSCRVWFLNVGQGDAEFVQTSDGSRILIDGGTDKTVLTKLGELLPPWDRRIDAAILSHPDADHVTGLADVLQRYYVGVIYESGVLGKSGAAKAMEQSPVKHTIVRTGDRLVFGDATFDILAPSNARPGSTPDAANALSVVVKLTCGGASVLFEGDLPAERERLLLKNDIHVDVLKVGHHGSYTSSDTAFLDALRPSAAVIEVGEGNTFGHPHPAVMQRLHSRDIRTYRTDTDGDVLFEAANGAWTLAPHPLPF